MVEFFSVDDQQKVRSRKRDVLSCGEANELEYDDFRQLLLRTVYRIYLDFNPDDDQIWINQEIEIKRAKLKGDVEVIVSSYLDNSFLNSEHVEEIELMKDTDEDYWNIFGKGQYVVFTNNRFFKNFSEDIHVQPVAYDADREIFLAFDFNIANSCLVIQSENYKIDVIREYRAELFDLETLCSLVRSEFPEAFITINGDASGRAGSAVSSGNASAYHIIKNALQLRWEQINVPGANPSHLNSYLQCIVGFKKAQVTIDPSCKKLINDLKNMKIIREPGRKLEIDKTNPDIGHLGDCLRYHFYAQHQYLLLKHKTEES